MPEPPPRTSAVTAAPNESLLEIRLLECARAPDDERKWFARFEVLSSHQLFGPQFSVVGQTAEGVCFESLADFCAGEYLDVHAEYLGDARHGVFKLSQPKKCLPK